MSKVQLFIDGEWCDSLSGKTIAVVNPATEEKIGEVAHAQREDLELAVSAAEPRGEASSGDHEEHRNRTMSAHGNRPCGCSGEWAVVLSWLVAGSCSTGPRGGTRARRTPSVLPDVRPPPRRGSAGTVRHLPGGWEQPPAAPCGRSSARRPVRRECSAFCERGRPAGHHSQRAAARVPRR